MSEKLAIHGGAPVFEGSFPHWPIVDDADRAALIDAMDGGVWGLGGVRSKQFRDAWAKFTGAHYAITTSSGTTALICAMRGLGIGAGAEVIIPAYTFQATATAILQLNAIPVFADIEPGNFCLDASAVESAITDRTRAIMPVHVAGCPADMDALIAIAEKQHLPIIEDACQAHGAAWRGRGVGSIGAAGAFSFQSSKNLAAGEGGAVTTSDAAIAGVASASRNCGTPDAGLESAPLAGANYRMTEFQAALLLSQMRRLPEQIARREENAAVLDRELGDVPGIRPLIRDERVTVHAHHLYIFRYSTDVFAGASRAAFIRALQAEGIPCHGGYQPLYRASFLADALRGTNEGWRHFSDRMYEHLRLPVTESACSDAIWLTQRLLLSDRAQIQAIVDAVAKIHQHRSELAKEGQRTEDGGC
ncbi:MAG TPA: DegT/DnrJ/EryC1/StrS family aminotransferase [Armatimonadota bacterium]|nr:DegT/DnrJ/EryC1/StrS family aminotransferase [Armatimonadota bacterium]